MTATLGAAASTPGAPTISSITGGDQTLTVNFTAPASDGGAAISNYKYSTDGTTYIARSPASTNSPLLLTGLANGTTYSVTLKAVNTIGDSTASSAVTGTPQAPALVPTVTPITISGKVGAAISTNIVASESPTSYQISSGILPTGLSLNAASGAITGAPSNVVSGYIVSVTASNAAGASAPADLTFNIAKGDQTITGLSANSTQYSTNAPYALSATASSGLAVSYASSDTNVATVSANTVTIVGLGTTTITASQAGDDNWNAAPNVIQTLTVTLPPPSITLTNAPTNSFNSALGTVSDVQTLQIIALNLTNDVIITPPAGFEASSDGNNFTSSLTLPKGSGGLTNDISLRLATNALGGLAGGSITVATATNGTNNLTRSTTLRGAVGVYWDFLNTASPVTNAVPGGWTLGPVGQGNNNGGAVALLTNSSASSGYTGASGGTNAGVAAQTGALNTSVSAYFEIPVVVPDTNTLTDFGVTTITFGTRSTGTGPVNYTIRSSKDNYASDLALGSMLATSTWAAVSNNNIGLVLTNGTNTIRIYGYGSASASQSGGTANWRIDDVVVTLASIINTNPTLKFLPNTVTGLKGFTGSASASSSYVVQGTNLTADVIVTAASGSIQVSSDNSNFTNTLTLTKVDGVVSNTIYTRLSASAPLGAVSGSVQHVSGSLTSNVSVSGTVYDSGRGGSSGTLAGWDVSDQLGGLGNFGPSPLGATISNSNVIVGGLTRGSGVATPATSTGAGRAWGGTTWEDTTSADAITNGKYVTFTLQAVSGKALSVTNLAKLNYRSASTTGPLNGLIQYKVGSGDFQDVLQVSYTANGNGQSISPINLSGISALQNVAADKQITFRIVSWGGTASANPGSWYIYDTANTPDVDLEVQGSLADSVTPPSVSYSPSVINGFVGQAISSLTPTVTGTVDTYSVSPSLPAGLSINSTNGVISGTPLVTATNTYTVTAANAGGSATTGVTIQVNKGTPIIVVPPTAPALTVGDALSTSSLAGGSASVAGTFAWTDGTITPAVGTSSQGVTFTPTDTANYNTATTTVNVTVNAATPSGSSFSGWLGSNSPSAALLLQYAYGASSASNAVNRSNLPSAVLSNNSLVMTYYVRKEATNPNLVTPQVHTNLADANGWGALAGSNIATVATNTVDGVDVVKKTATVPTSDGAKKFLRLKVSE